MSTQAHPAAWETFPIPASSNQPPLFIQRNFKQASYSVYVTDLTNIWGETLRRDAIIDRADDLETAIRPETDDGQMAKLLEMLELAVTGTKENVDMEMDIRQTDGKAALTLSIREPLQKPLGDLNWKFRLKPLSQKTLSQELILPMLSLASFQSRGVEALLAIIKEKDTVIERFVNMLKDQKVDLATIFPGYKKGRMLTGKSRGLATFDQPRWIQNLMDEHDKDLSATMRQAYAVDNDKVFAQCYADGKRLFNYNAEHWWSGWKGKVKVKGDAPSLKAILATPKAIVQQDQDEDEFEQIKSSPQARKSSPAADVEMTAHFVLAHAKEEQADNEDDDTTSDEDLDAPASSIRSPSIKLETKPIHSKVNKKFTPEDDQTSSEDEVIPPTKSSQAKSSQTLSDFIDKEEGNDRDDNAMAVDDNVVTKAKIDVEDEEEQLSAAPKKGLVRGKIIKTIGGKKKATASTTFQVEGKRKNDDDTSDEEISSSSANNVKKKKESSPLPPAKEETPMEAADRKREELARQLEAKRNAPKKKTRRF